MVSHDRHFLNEIVTDVVHFHQGKLTTYRGGELFFCLMHFNISSHVLVVSYHILKDINNFTAVKEENRKRQIRLYEQQEAKRAHLQKYIDLHAQAGENGVKAAKQRKSRMKKVSIYVFT